MNHRLDEYRKLVSFLGRVLGPDYEIVLHDLTEKSSSVVAIENSFSKRHVGSPITQKAIGFLEDRLYLENDWVLNYPGKAMNNVQTVSSTMFIKDADGKPIGLLCINHNITRCVEAANRVLDLFDLPLLDQNTIEEKRGGQEKPEIFTNSIEEMIASTIRNTIPLDTPVDHLNQAEKMMVIRKLKEYGIFSVKGAVREAARQLECSEPTVYRYIKIAEENE